MIRVSVLYPDGDGKTFDHDYYANSHIPMVTEKLKSFGLAGGAVDKGLGGAAPGAPAPYVSIGHLLFETIEGFQQAFGAHGEEIMADIPNYTNIEPIIQISEIALEA